MWKRQNSPDILPFVVSRCRGITEHIQNPVDDGFNEGVDNILMCSGISSAGFDLMEDAKLHRVVYPHLIPIRRLPGLLHIYMQPMAAVPATHAHNCLRTLAADLDMTDYILFRHNITKRQSSGDIVIPYIRGDIDSLVLGSTLYGES